MGRGDVLRIGIGICTLLYMDYMVGGTCCITQENLPVFCDNLYGNVYVYMYKLNHFAIQQKLMQIVNQLFFNKKQD